VKNTLSPGRRNGESEQEHRGWLVEPSQQPAAPRQLADGLELAHSGRCHMAYFDGLADGICRIG
jgi:prepilin-type processing-associated H-X9-DG protein